MKRTAQPKSSNDAENGDIYWIVTWSFETWDSPFHQQASFCSPGIFLYTLMTNVTKVKLASLAVPVTSQHPSVGKMIMLG